MNARRVLTCAAVAWLCAVAWAAAQGMADDAVRPTRAARPSAVRLDDLFAAPARATRLPNGLTLVTVPFHSDGIVAYHTLVRVGSRDEIEPGLTGFAHLFEHMMFRGTERYPEKAYEAVIQRLGADNNAFTTEDYTLYTITAPSGALAKLVEIEADRFQRLRYDETQFRTEAGAVLGEYHTSTADPTMRMWEALSELAFRTHPYGHTTLGFVRDIRAMPDKLAESRRFFADFYTPDNAVILVVGDVRHEHVERLVRRHYGAWHGTRARPVIPVEPPPKRGEARHIAWPGSAPPKLLMGYRTPSYAGTGDETRADAIRTTAALEVLHGLVFGESSPLYRELVVERERLLDFGSWSGDFDLDPHLFIVYATLADGVAFDEIVARIQAELATLERSARLAARIDAVRSNLLYGMITDVETPADAAELLASFYAVDGVRDVAAPTAVVAEYLAALRALTPADVTRAASQYLGADRRFVVTLAPEAKRNDVGARP